MGGPSWLTKLGTVRLLYKCLEMEDFQVHRRKVTEEKVSKQLSSNTKVHLLLISPMSPKFL